MESAYCFYSMDITKENFDLGLILATLEKTKGL
jgi:hypothetical protein